MVGQVKGFRHTEEAKALISAAMRGRRPAGFLIVRPCPSCGVQMNAPNLGRHQPACEAKAASGLFPEKSVRQLKTMRRKLRPYGLTPADYAKLWAAQGGESPEALSKDLVRMLADLYSWKPVRFSDLKPGMRFERAISMDDRRGIADFIEHTVDAFKRAPAPRPQ